MSQSLAVKYRPHEWSDVVEQDNIKIILQQQLDSGELQHAYLFCGGAGTGKTTCARIFANEINHGQGIPIELDAASHNGVDDVREIIKQAQLKSLDSEYKIFIVDECHSISNTGWQAFLKLLEEPPAKSIFIFCTTDPNRIPKTILSRVQRYDFQRISQKGIANRLMRILSAEDKIGNSVVKIDEAVEYIAKLSEGGMRDAITMLDKCLAYSTELTLENVIKAIGVTDYDVMIELLHAITHGYTESMLKIISDVYYAGKDLKLFIKQFTNFVLDVVKYNLTNSLEYTQIPNTYADRLHDFASMGRHLLLVLVKLNSEIKWETSPKAMIEATLLLEVNNDRTE